MSATDPTYPLLGKRVRILATLLPDFYGTVELVRIFPRIGLFTYLVRLDEPKDCMREFQPDQLEEATV